MLGDGLDDGLLDVEGDEDEGDEEDGDSPLGEDEGEFPDEGEEEDGELPEGDEEGERLDGLGDMLEVVELAIKF